MEPERAGPSGGGRGKGRFQCRVEDVEDPPLEGPLNGGSDEWGSRTYLDYYTFYDTSVTIPSPQGHRSPSIHSVSSPLLNSIADLTEEQQLWDRMGPIDVHSSHTYLRDEKEIEGSFGHLAHRRRPASDSEHPMKTVGRPIHVVHSEDKRPPPNPFSPGTLYFRDGRRKIDMVLAYEDNGEQSSTAVRRRQRRHYFQSLLDEEGFQFELEDKSHSQDGKTYFLKIHAPWEVLTRFAELMNLKMPIKEENDEEEEDQEDQGLLSLTRCLDGHCPSFQYDKSLIPDEPHYYTGAFNRERAKQFLIKSQDTFFNDGQRSRLVWDALMRARYDENDPERVGIQRLLSNGTYTSAFALHDGSYTKKLEDNEPLNHRRILFQEWAQIRCMFKVQPLPLIRKYFGEKIGIYFAWLGFYTYMLTAPAFVGVVCFLYGWLSLSSDVPTQEVCDINGIGGTIMCPICERCPLRKLYDSCDIAKVTYLFDNDATVFFAVFMSFWATLFLEYWKRYQSRIAWEWDLADLEDEEGISKSQEAQENAAENAQVEDGNDNSNCQDKGTFLALFTRVRSTRIVATGSCILLMLFVALATVLGVIAYRIVVVRRLINSGDKFVSENADWISSITASIINFVFIVILDKVYRWISKWLTNLEQPRTQTEYEDSFTFKMFLFQFINFYSSLVYIAFCKGRIPAENESPIMIDQCDPTGCMNELVIQLIIIMAGKQILNNVNEFLTPVILNWWRSHKSKSRTRDVSGILYTRWEQDYDLAALDRMALFDEYIEMVIQFGFVTLFVSAFPLAPLFALLNNLVEIRLDAYKLVTQVRRPVAARARDIGVWYSILKALTILSVISNAFVIAYTSDFVPRMVYLHYYSKDQSLAGYINSSLSMYNTSDTKKIIENGTLCWYVDQKTPPEDPNKYLHTLVYWHIFCARLAFIVVYEHVVFSLTGAIAYLIPDVPSDVKAKLLSEKLLAKEALYEAELEKVRRERVQRKDQGGMDPGTQSGAEDASASSHPT